ncbi:uncharacterized protein LOC132278127 [Cornus florida]|uniref:uncharacterized protein LOC132278127 n=1 Tax=Cornus florida TaxID=4283 RepID=UPI00289CA701|nr:uncharacterized protein LOC132278127 [Cornus florida]
MANWRSFGDRLLYCHRSTLKKWCNCPYPVRFHNSSTTRGGGDLLLGDIKKVATFPQIPGSSSFSPPPVSSPRLLSSSPLLLLPPGVVVVDDNRSSVNRNSRSNDDYFHFFSLLEQSQFRIPKNLSCIRWQRDLLTPQNVSLCGGSSDGWLAFTDKRNGHPYLYNPLMESPDFPYIPLPSLKNVDFYSDVRKPPFSPSPNPLLLTQFIIEDRSYFYLRKLVMSSAPSFPCYSSSSSSPLGNDCTIMATHSATSGIVFCKPGDDRWTKLKDSLFDFRDIIYFSKDERFYALDFSHHSMEAWDLRDPSCPKNQVFDRPSFCPGKLEHKFLDRCNFNWTNHLVESSGDLLLLKRFRAPSVVDQSGFAHPQRLEEKVMENNNIHDEEWENHSLHNRDATLGFDVHKFDFDHNKWEHVECLGDQALFVGLNTSFSISTCDYPQLMGNSIYFTDDLHGHDNGVFHLEDGCIKPCYPKQIEDH